MINLEGADQTCPCEPPQTSEPKPAALYRLESLTCEYPGETALDAVSLEFPPGRLIAICGYSGSGKTTLLNTLGLLQHGSIISGKIQLLLPDGTHNYTDLGGKTRRFLRREKFGFVLQSSYLLPNLSNRHNIEMPLLIQEKSEAHRTERVESLLKDLCNDDPEQSDLEPVLDRLPKAASGGQRQRIAILRAMVHDPAVIFADEPCSNLDPLNRESVMHLLQKWLKARPDEGQVQQLRSILLVSHDTESVIQFADEILILRKGKVVGGRLFRRSDFPADMESARTRLKALMRTGSVSTSTPP